MRKAAMVTTAAMTAAMAAAASALVGAAPPGERVVRGDGLVATRIEGADLQLRIDPAAPAMPLLESAHAELAGLKPGPFGIGYHVGPQVVHGRTAVGRIAIAGGAPFKRRIGWTTRAYAPGLDGMIGPGGLPDPVVRFVLRAGMPGERTVALPMLDQGGLGAGWGASYARIDVGGVPMRVAFDPYHPRTLASAGAAVRLAAAQGGSISGRAVATEIAFGIERPVRTLTLDRALMVGPIAVSVLGVRTADYGRATTIPDKDADPDETVMVVARGKRADPARDRLSIGADLLARCSSIVFDTPAHVIRLTCA